MTWVSHILVGSSAGKIAGYSYVLSAFGSVLPDLIEYIIPSKHRGISHSLAMWLILFAIGWVTGIEQIRAILVGVLVGHLLMDSLTITGVPFWDENGRYITLFGGKVRTGTASEYAISIIIALIAYSLSYSGITSIKQSSWKTLYEQGIIDKKEYKENRFKIL